MLIASIFYFWALLRELFPALCGFAIFWPMTIWYNAPLFSENTIEVAIFALVMTLGTMTMAGMVKDKLEKSRVYRLPVSMRLSSNTKQPSEPNLQLPPETRAVYNDPCIEGFTTHASDLMRDVIKFEFPKSGYYPTCHPPPPAHE